MSYPTNQDQVTVVPSGSVVATTKNVRQVVSEMKEQVALIQGAIAAVMKEGEHFGNIPGCGDKKTLLKPGAEKLMIMFRLGVDPIVEAYDTGDNITYRVKSRLFHIETGNTVGFGLGECSTLEEKYNWRSVVCDEEFEATPDDRKRVKWAKKDGRGYQIKQIRTNYKDLSNTVLKMAKKRSLVDGVLTCTAASDCFTQDLEDFDPEFAAELASEGKNTKAHTSPKASSAAANATVAEETSALKTYGLWISTKDGIDTVEGNTYQKGDLIKQFGFKWDGDAKKWKRPAKTATQPATEKPTEPSKTPKLTLSSLSTAIAVLGGEMSEAVDNGKGRVFVQATGLVVDDTVEAELKKLGFVFTANKWVRDVTSLTVGTDNIEEEAKTLF
jgi:hypothetical protein